MRASIGSGPAVAAEGLRKRYGETVALDGLDLEVARGSVCGLLGPNGAGKTTTVQILTTLRRADAGRAEVAGFDVARDGAEVRRRIGLVGQSAAIDEVLGGRQNLVMFGRLLGLGRAGAARRADELLERFDLTDAADRAVKDYSGGMRRRLDLAASLILSPPVMFLDEPTAGLDPRGRNEVWTAVRGLAGGGATVLLTTQYLEEADRLADAIALIDHGRVVAEGSPDELKARFGGDWIEVVVADPETLADAAAIVAASAAGEPELDPDRRRVSAPVRDRIAALGDVMRGLAGAEIAAEDVAVRRPTLDEVFLEVVS